MSIGVVVTPTSAADNSDASQKVELGDQRDASDLAMRDIGRVLWKRQPGTSDFDEARGVATDRQDNVYVVGETGGALGGPNKGGVDAWVIKYDWSGRVLWKRQPGTDGGDSANAVATDEEGNVYVAGRSEESHRLAATMRGSSSTMATVVGCGSGGSRPAAMIWRTASPPTRTAMSISWESRKESFSARTTC